MYYIVFGGLSLDEGRSYKTLAYYDWSESKTAKSNGKFYCCKEYVDGIHGSEALSEENLKYVKSNYEKYDKNNTSEKGYIDYVYAETKLKFYPKEGVWYNDPITVEEHTYRIYLEEKP